MKHTIRILTALVLAAAAGLAGAQDLPKTHLKILGGQSVLAHYKDYEQPFWTKEIPEKSGGAITAEIKGINEMGLAGPEIGRLVKLGVLDFATANIGQMAADDPKNEAIDLAGLCPDIATARKVTEAYRPVLEKLYKEKYGAKLLAIWPFPAQVLFSRLPIINLSDLKGMKVRTYNRTLIEFIQAVGGTGLPLAFAEVVQAMQTGVVDAAVTGSLSGYHAKWYEVSDYLYALPVGWAHNVHMVSYNTWNKLDPKVRSFIEKEIKGLEDRSWKMTDEQTAQGFACNTGEGKCNYGKPAKMKLCKMSAADKVVLAKILEEVVLKKWGERCGKGCSEEFNETIGKVIDAKVK